MAKITGGEPTRIAAWSHSRWSEYERCPLRCKLKTIDKLREPQGPALARGEAIHKAIEAYLTNRGTPVPEEIHAQLRPEYARMKRRKIAVELDLAFTSGWEPTGWFDANAWCRVKIDALVEPRGRGAVVGVYDHKTGKVKSAGEYDAQLELYALAGMLARPHAKRAETKLFFTDHGVTVSPDEQFERKDTEMLKDRWAGRTRAMLSDTRFDPRPGPHCRWCSFQKSKGGPCEF